MLKATGKEKAKLILDSSSSDSDSEDEALQSKKKGSINLKKTHGELKINKNYAERYDNWRNLEEMQKLKNRLGVTDINELNEDDLSSSESSSEDDDEWTADKEKAFLKTLACLKMKNPKIYSDEFGYFKDIEDGDEGETSAAVSPKKKTKKEDKKPFTVRDHERKMILEKGGQLSDDDEDGDQSKGKSYPEQLASIKTAFSKALNEIDSSEDEGEDGLLGSKLLKPRTVKSDQEKLKEEEEYRLWLKGELDKLDKGKLSKQDEKDLKSLKDYWNDDKLDEGEKFLRDYILNKKYIDPSDKDYIPSFNEVVHDDDDLSNDEKFEQEREEFEHKYNFRFEEPDQEFIKRYPRTVQESMRREDTKRKEQRQKTKERKEEIKARKKEEVQRLKALKRKEIMDKIQKLHEITGDPELNLSEVDIDGDFDPEEYDKRMQQIFNDNYYKQGMDEEKPVFEYDEELDGDEERWDKWVPPHRTDEDEDINGDECEENDDQMEGDGQVLENEKEDLDFFGRRGKRASTQKELIDASKGKRGRKKRSVFLEVLEREKPKFDPKIHKSFEQYFEEYYKLDFEDIVGGDVKCRFKYHKTIPNDFGLSTEEILKAQDKELNQWASLKKTYQYRQENEEEYEVKAYKKKAEREDLKKRILPSVYQPTPEKSTDESDAADGEAAGTQKKRKKKKKKNKNKTLQSHSEVVSPPSEKEIKKVQKSPKKSDKALPPSPEKSKKHAQSPLSETPATVSPTQKLSKRQRKNKKKLSRSGLAESESNGSAKDQPVVKPKPTDNTNKKENGSGNTRGKKRKAPNQNQDNDVAVDEDRLRSYGLNPKKFKKQMKYGKSRVQT